MLLNSGMSCKIGHVSPSWSSCGIILTKEMSTETERESLKRKYSEYEEKKVHCKKAAEKDDVKRKKRKHHKHREQSSSSSSTSESSSESSSEPSSSSSSSSDSDSSSDEDLRKRNKQKHKHKDKHKKKKKEQRRSKKDKGPVQLSAFMKDKHKKSKHEERSAMSGKKIQRKIKKSKIDKKRDKSRGELLKFLNATM